MPFATPNDPFLESLAPGPVSIHSCGRYHEAITALANCMTDKVHPQHEALGVLPSWDPERSLAIPPWNALGDAHSSLLGIPVAPDRIVEPSLGAIFVGKYTENCPKRRFYNSVRDSREKQNSTTYVPIISLLKSSLRAVLELFRGL